MDSKLESITLKQLSALEDILSNDDNSSNEELQRLFVDQFGLSEDQAEQGLTYRPPYSLNTYLQGHGPILVGEDAQTLRTFLGLASAPRKSDQG